MNPWQTQVGEFCGRVGEPTAPDRPEIRRANLRARLLVEETVETVVALVGASEAAELMREFAWEAQKMGEHGKGRPDLVEVVDGLCDVIYVALGTAEACGVDLEPHFAAVHASNLSKIGSGRDINGKIVKPEGWTPPDICGILKGQGA